MYFTTCNCLLVTSPFTSFVEAEGWLSALNENIVKGSTPHRDSFLKVSPVLIENIELSWSLNSDVSADPAKKYKSLCHI